MVQVSTNVQINTTNFANATMLRDLLIQNVTDSGFDIVISSIRVDGLALTTQSLPLQLRFTNLNFTNDLTMRGSARFNGLSANITNVVNNIYMNNPNFVDIVVNEFRSGSVVSSTTISVQPDTISLAGVAQTLANNTALFASAGLRFDVNALTNTTTTPTAAGTTITSGTTTTTAGTTTTTAGTTITTAGTTITTTGPTVNQPTPTQPFPSYAIAIIVMCILSLIALIFVIVLCVKTGYCSKVEKAFRLESPEILDTRLPMFGLDAVYRPDPNYRRAIVNGFRNGSIIANCTLEYGNTTPPPTGSEVVRQLVNSLANGTDLGNVTLIPGTISSGGTTLNNLQPISLSISYVIENMAFTNTLNNMSSTEFINLTSSVINWLKPVLTSVFGARTTSNYNVSFSNVTTMVQVSTNVQINTTNFANATMLRDLLIQNVTDSGFDIVISSIRVDGLALTTQSLPLQLRFTNLNFTNDLTMRGSARFNGLSANITNVVNNIYMNNPNFVDIVVNEFRSGSVVSSTTISVQPNTISQAEAAQTLANNTALFASAGLRLDVNALTNTTTAPTTAGTTITSGTTTTTAGTTTTTAGTTITTAGTTITTTGPTVNQPTPTQPFPSYAIAIIVMCILSVIALIFVIVLCVKTGYCSKVANAIRLESPEISDTRLPMFGGQSHNFN
ncbi:uncharacterized protein LOC144610856 [Rhinoraja longicauda]